MSKLSHDAEMWNAFAGACVFPDGTEPFFAETSLQSYDAIMVLDSQGYPGEDQKTVLTLNVIDSEGNPKEVWERSFSDELTREEIIQWAGDIGTSVTEKELLLAGFVRIPC